MSHTYSFDYNNAYDPLEAETAHAISAIAMPAGSEPLNGRDVLNQLVITLDGIAGVTELQLGP